LILGADKGRLSKRHGATSVQAFRDAGILPEAMVNYLARLGWSHGDQEIFTRDELIRAFDLGQVGVAGAVFDYPKLEWLSHHWLKQVPSARLAAELTPFLERLGLPAPAALAWLGRVVDTLRERAKTLREMAEQASFYIMAPAEYDPQATAKFWTGAAGERYALIVRRLEAQESMDPDALELLYRGLTAALDVKLVDLAQLTRIALTGKAASPPIFQVMSILGKAEALARLRAAKAALGSAR